MPFDRAGHVSVPVFDDRDHAVGHGGIIALRGFRERHALIRKPLILVFFDLYPDIRLRLGVRLAKSPREPRQQQKRRKQQRKQSSQFHIVSPVSESHSE